MKLKLFLFAFSLLLFTISAEAQRATSYTKAEVETKLLGKQPVIMDNIQTYTTGDTVVVADYNNVLLVNPATVKAILTVKLPDTPDYSKELSIFFGGTILSNIAVVDSIRFYSGSTIVTRSAGAKAGGSSLVFKKLGSVWYRKE